MQNAVVLVVGQLRRGVDTTTAGYDLLATIRARKRHRNRRTGL